MGRRVTNVMLSHLGGKVLFHRYTWDMESPASLSCVGRGVTYFVVVPGTHSHQRSFVMRGARRRQRLFVISRTWIHLRRIPNGGRRVTSVYSSFIGRRDTNAFSSIVGT